MNGTFLGHFLGPGQGTKQTFVTSHGRILKIHHSFVYPGPQQSICCGQTCDTGIPVSASDVEGGTAQWPETRTSWICQPIWGQKIWISVSFIGNHPLDVTGVVPGSWLSYANARHLQSLPVPPEELLIIYGRVASWLLLLTWPLASPRTQLEVSGKIGPQFLAMRTLPDRGLCCFFDFFEHVLPVFCVRMNPGNVDGNWLAIFITWPTANGARNPFFLGRGRVLLTGRAFWHDGSFARCARVIIATIFHKNLNFYFWKRKNKILLYVTIKIQYVNLEVDNTIQIQ